MEEEKQRKTKQAIAKLIGYKEGDRVIITSDFTGETYSKTDSTLLRSWNANRGLKGMEATIVEVLVDRDPIGYKLDGEGVTSNGNYVNNLDVWVSDSFVRKELW